MTSSECPHVEQKPNPPSLQSDVLQQGNLGTRAGDQNHLSVEQQKREHKLKSSVQIIFRLPPV